MNAITPETMQRLAFIRLLTQQGLDQSRQPDPLAAAAILTFHDAVELFLMLASEHLGVTVPDRGTNFVSRYFDGLHPDKAGANGVDLAGRMGIKRLTDHRNAFKHAAAVPSGQSIEQARADTTRFFEDNTPRVFDVPFDKIDMADLVPQSDTRVNLQLAKKAELKLDRVQAMALLAEALDGLLKDSTSPGHWQPTPFSFGRDVSYPLPERDVRRILRQPPERDRHMPARGAEKLAEELVIVRDSVRALQRGARITALGLDYASYLRFNSLVPSVYRRTPNDDLDVSAPDGYDPSAEEFAFCERFVISAALRIADVMRHRERSSWEA